MFVQTCHGNNLLYIVLFSWIWVHKEEPSLTAAWPALSYLTDQINPHQTKHVGPHQVGQYQIKTPTIQTLSVVPVNFMASVRHGGHPRRWLPVRFDRDNKYIPNEIRPVGVSWRPNDHHRVCLFNNLSGWVRGVTVACQIKQTLQGTLVLHCNSSFACSQQT